MFLESGDKVVNTDSVTNIVIEGNKVIFNLDYGVSLQENIDKIIPDYVYMIIKNDEELADMKAQIDTLGWLTSTFGNYDRNNNYRANNRIVNPSAISFIKYEGRKNRIIFNLRNSISFNREVYKKTSDFVYFDHVETSDFENECTRISAILGAK